MRLTKRVVDSIAPPVRGQVFYRDEKLTGFALRVTSGGAKSFIVEVRVKGRNRRKTLGRYGHLTVEQARREARKYLGKVEMGIDPEVEARAAEARNMTLQALFDDYIAVHKDLKPSTVHDYHRVICGDLKDWLNRPLASISKDAVAHRHERLGRRSHARANNAMRVLRALFNFARGQYEDAEGRSLFPENPVSRLSHTRAWYPNQRRRTVILPSQLPAWYAGVMALRADLNDEHATTVADYLLLLLFTGLRRTEGMTLLWSDVDLAGKTLLIRETKNGEPLHLPLSDYLLALFERRAARVTSPYVFPGDGEHGHLIEPRKQMRKVISQSGVNFTLHDLRRTFITLAERLELSVYAIKRLVNHKMANDVTAGYVVMDPERLRPAMQKITDYLLEQVNPPREDNVIILPAVKCRTRHGLSPALS